MPHRTGRALLRLAVVVLATASLTAATGGSGPAGADDTLPPLTNSSRPTIVGTGWSEDSLSVEVGEWSTGTTPRYVGARWYRDDGHELAVCPRLCTIRLSPDDIGHEVYVDVSAEDPCCSRYHETSAPIMISGPHPVTGPSFHGPRGLELGGRLVADDPGEWTFPVDHYDYRWFRSGVLGQHLTLLTGEPTYRTVPRDLGHCLVLLVHANGSDGHEGTAVTDPACYVTAAPMLRLHKERGRRGPVAVARALYSHPGRTIEGTGRLIVYLDGEAIRSRAVTSPHVEVRFPLPSGRHEIGLFGRGAHHTGRTVRTFEIRHGTIVRR